MSWGVRRLVRRPCFTAVNLETWLNKLISLDLSFLNCYGRAVIGEDSIETLVDVPVTIAINKLSQIGWHKPKTILLCKRFHGLDIQAGLSWTILFASRGNY